MYDAFIRSRILFLVIQISAVLTEIKEIRKKNQKRYPFSLQLLFPMINSLDIAFLLWVV